MDAIALLKKDHMTVKRLFERFEKARSGKKEIADRIVKELAVHAAIEEQLFYPAVKDAEPTRDLVLESYEEHKQMKMVLSDLASADKKTPEWKAGLKVLMEDVQHHVGEEEKELFPKVSKLQSKQELEDLGARMEQLKMQQLAAVKGR